MRPIRAICVLCPIVLALGSLASAAAAAPVQDVHKNDRFGYQLKPPKDWRSIALKTDEQWLTAKFQSDKSYFYSDKDTGYTYEHKPELLCIAFIRENLEKKRVVEEEEEDGVTTKTITLLNPYKDYEDFLDRTYAGGGWYVDVKEEGESGGIPVTVYEIKVEKLARSGPKRILTWVFHTADIDYAVQTEILADDFDKLSKTIERTLKSFKEIERSGQLLPTGQSVEGRTITRRELTTGTPKERRTKRVESQKQVQEKTIASLPDDWDYEYSGDILIVNHEQAKWAERLGEHAQVMLAWFEKNLYYIGEGEYARAPIIRVCKDDEEERAFSRGVLSGSSGGWYYVAPGEEILTHKDDAGWIGFEVGWVNRNLLRNWMAERDEDLANALPEWLAGGLYDFVEGARQEGRSLDFRVDDWNRDSARLAASQGRATPPRDIMRFTREEFASEGGRATGETYWGRRAETGMLVRFLMSKEATRDKYAKDLLEKYVVTLAQVVEEVKKKETDAFKSEGDAKSEEEEDARAKARAERLRSLEKDLIQTTYERVFADWSDKDWEKFEKAYFDYISS